MTLRIINIKQMEKKANEPSFSRKPARAARTVVKRISRDGRREHEPHVVPTERDRANFEMYSPEEVGQGYKVKWAEKPREPLEAD